MASVINELFNLGSVNYRYMFAPLEVYTAEEGITRVVSCRLNYAYRSPACTERIARYCTLADDIEDFVEAIVDISSRFLDVDPECKMVTVEVVNPSKETRLEEDIGCLIYIIKKIDGTIVTRREYADMLDPE